MTEAEVKRWRRTRARGRARFLGGIILRRSLWLSMPFALTLMVTGLQPEHDHGFWSNCECLAWVFAGVSLFIGVGDGLFLWRLREQDYQRQTRLANRNRADHGISFRDKRELNAVSGGRG